MNTTEGTEGSLYRRGNSSVPHTELGFFSRGGEQVAGLQRQFQMSELQLEILVDSRLLPV